MAKTAVKPKQFKINEDSNGLEARRLDVLKTYKIYIGGKFPRTESGRYYILKNENGKPLANICRSSRKDFRESVVAARAAFKGWSSRAAINRGQILYRIAEMLEGRKTQFIEELILQGSTKKSAEREVNASIDRLIYYAGWCDKYQQIFSSVNPVASSHFNFSLVEPTGVVAIIAPEENSLIGLVSVIAPIIAGGNTCIVLASESKPLCAVTFAEVLHSSDVPGGCINILTGSRVELYSHFSSHMDVNAILYSCLPTSPAKLQRSGKQLRRESGADEKMIKEIQANATSNVKRVVVHKNIDWYSNEAETPYFIMDTQEIKTTWHPVGI